MDHCKIPVGQNVKKFYLCDMVKRKEKIEDSLYTDSKLFLRNYFAPHRNFTMIHNKLMIIFKVVTTKSDHF